VFDRIRENIKGQSNDRLKNIINTSINQTLSRTILTSGTTLLVVAALFIFGGGAIHDFALALLVGIFVGTYSSIFVASPVLLGFGPSTPVDAQPKESTA
ncbi:MAG: protein translocase subunit SecF, partial [Desulfovibrio sp.]|nr:protein translocase subunit SecF [Desulfovibrio sp.]